jgi:hypothetical protein
MKGNMTMSNKEKIGKFADDYTESVIQFYRDQRNAGITPTNTEILAACPIPTNLGDIEHEAFVIIVMVTQLVDADMNTAPKAESTVKSTSHEWQRRRARLAELETKAVNAKRQARVKQLRADNEAQARQKALDDHMEEMLVQSRARQAEKAARSRLDTNMAVRQAAVMMSYPRPQ